MKNLKIIAHACFLATLASLTSCSFGTWEDDDKNWIRAFNVVKPDEIKIKHSWYWKSPHFTLEQEYFFELELSDSLEKLFFQPGDLVKVDSAEFYKIYSFNPKPRWFVPDSYKSYEAYKSTQYKHYFLFINRRKGSIFITDYQI